MTKEEFIKFEELVRTKHVYWADSEGYMPEVFRVELFENGEHGTWVNIFAKDCTGGCSLEGFKLSDFQVLGPIKID